MLNKPQQKKLVAGKKEVIVQVGKTFYKLRPFKDTDGGSFGQDLDTLQKKYHISLLREAD